jgi:hypothetical protein
MVDPHEQPDEEQPLTERLFDLFVFLPTGLVVTVAEEVPRLAEIGRDRLGVRVNSARAVGKLVVSAGQQELKRRSSGLKRTPSTPPVDAATAPGAASAPRVPPRLRTIPYPPETDDGASVPTAVPTPSDAAVGPDTAVDVPRPRLDAHTPEVTSLAIPGFDTLSASQVVQRLDGLSRGELVSVRAYETSTRGRRTILSRVDQLLDERS